MPFLRRRGVMASESDMRRHTTLFDPKVQADDVFLDLRPANHRPENGTASQDSNGDGFSTSPHLNFDPIQDTARVSQDSCDRPDTPPIQEETPRHRRFSMLRFRNASDSQLSTRLKQQQQAEKPPPMPARMFFPLPFCPRGRHSLTHEVGFSSCHYHNCSCLELHGECHVQQEVECTYSLANAPFG